MSTTKTPTRKKSNMYIKIDNPQHSFKGVIEVRCPHCGHVGSFEKVATEDSYGENFIEGIRQRYWLGLRRCPRVDCHGQVLFQELDGDIETYPSQKIEFDKNSIPSNIVECFDEALTCESAKCYVASAIMVRKTLELVCEERGARGKDLLQKIESLKTQVTLPQSLFEGMQNLRLLGNDAAHVESKDFDDIGKEELEVAIDLTREVLKSIYQLGSIVERLQKLKKVTDVEA